jgi:two-component system cell cycle sensor histidine kinase/response regulator CckA
MNGNGETILVVEDEHTVLEIVSSVLASNGYRVLKAALPSEAIAIVKAGTNTIDIILTDIVMPEMKGTDMVAQIKTLLPSAKIIYMSGYSNHAIIEPELAQNLAHFIQKPFMPKDLLEKIEFVCLATSSP